MRSFAAPGIAATPERAADLWHEQAHPAAFAYRAITGPAVKALLILCAEALVTIAIAFSPCLSHIPGKTLLPSGQRADCRMAFARRTGGLHVKQHFSERDTGIFPGRYVADSPPPFTWTGTPTRTPSCVAALPRFTAISTSPIEFSYQKA